MALVHYRVVCRNSGSTPPGAPVTGVVFPQAGGFGSLAAGGNPGWVFLKLVEPPFTNVTARPVVSEVGGGQYDLAWDAEVDGEASGQLDFGSTLNPIDRYVDVFLTADSSRIAQIPAVQARTDNLPDSPAAAGGQMALSQPERDAITTTILDHPDGVESGLTMRQLQRLIGAILGGRTSGVEPGAHTETYKGVGVNTNRASATIDAAGNRTGLALTLSDAPPSGGGAPPQVTGLTLAVISTTEIDLSWDVTPTATSYQVERSPDGATGWTQIGAPSGAGFQDQPLTPGTRYYYRVSAVSSNGNGLYSAIANNYTLPDVPTGLIVTPASVTQINVSWNAVGSATAYRVERSLNGTSGWSVVGTPVSNTLNNVGLNPGTQYFYRISAINPGGTGPSGTAAGAYTLPAQVTNLVVAPTGTTSFTLTWDAMASAASYLVERSLDGSTGWATIGTPGAATLNDTGRTPGTRYFYRVSAVNPSGTGASSAVINNYTLPSQVAGLAANSISTSEIDLTWTALAPAPASYSVERSLNGTTGWTVIGTPTTNAFANTGLDANTQYFYRVRATNPGGSGAYSANANATTSAGGFAPASLPGYFAEYDAQAEAVRRGLGTGATANLDTWQDRAAGAHHILQATGANQLLLAHDGTRWRAVGSGGQYAAVDWAAIPQPFTVHVVGYMTVSNGVFFDGGPTGGGRALLSKGIFDANMDIWAGVTAGYAQGVPTGLHLWTCIFDGAASELLLDGVSQVVANAGSNALRGITVGAAFSAVGPLTGGVGAIVVCTGHQAGADIANYLTYAQARYTF
jgi:fibronectin type 3 domain-containing protein